MPALRTGAASGWPPVQRNGRPPNGARFALAYAANRRAAIESVIDSDPVASRVREIMADRHIWIGTAAELLNYRLGRQGDHDWDSRSGWPRSPRALAGRLRRAQPGLRSLGIDIVFSREGRAGTRIITMRRGVEHAVRTASPSAA
jgi:hypothetical protein